MSPRAGRILAFSLAALVFSLAASGPATAAERFYADPAIEGQGQSYPPATGFDGPCGLAVDAEREFYVADYHRHVVDVFKFSRNFQTQLKQVDPEDGPCGLAVDATGNLYVNSFHGQVVRYPATLPLAVVNPYGPGEVVDPGPATGVAVDLPSGDVYVDRRTYVAVYDAGGAQVEVGGEPLRIGEGSLGSGYGVAVSSYAASGGYVYVADAADETIKVYDPGTDPAVPMMTIKGSATPEGRFVSLRDAALALDQSTGKVFVTDELQPRYYERPEATVYGFEAGGSYIGRLANNIVDARPAGLTVDNSGKGSQGRVYVTSGNAEGSFVWAYDQGEIGLTIIPALTGLPVVPPAPPPLPAAASAPPSLVAAPDSRAGRRAKAHRRRHALKRRLRAQHRRHARRDHRPRRRHR